jgi:hypothetical protein
MATLGIYEILPSDTEEIKYMVHKLNYIAYYIKVKRDELAPAPPPPVESKYDVRKFMETQYPTMKRITLSDIAHEYKKIHNIRIPQDVLRRELEQTGLYRITNCSHKLIAIKED